MNNADLFLPISFVSDEKEKKAFDERHIKFKSIEELLKDRELIRAMAFVNMVRRDGRIIDSFINVVNKIAKKAHINMQMNDFVDGVKINMEVARLRKSYISKQKKLLNKGRAR